MSSTHCLYVSVYGGGIWITAAAILGIMFIPKVIPVTKIFHAHLSQGLNTGRPVSQFWGYRVIMQNSRSIISYCDVPDWSIMEFFIPADAGIK